MVTGSVQSIWSAVADPSRSRSEVNSLLTKHWGESFVATVPIPPSAHIKRLHLPAIRGHLENSIRIYKKFAQTKRALKKQRQLQDEEEKADVSGLPQLLVEDSFDLSTPESFCEVFMKPQPGCDDPLMGTGSRKSTNPFEAAVPSRASTNPFEEPVPVWRERSDLRKRLESLHDTVDARLAARLRAKTDAFFKIVTSYSSLQSDIEDAKKQIGKVRNSLSVASCVILERSNHLMQLHDLREQKRKMLTRLRDMMCLRDAQQTVQSFLSQGEYPRALECIHTSQDVLTHALSGVVAFRHLSSQMSGLQDAIGRLMQDDLVQTIQKEFGTKVDEPGIILCEGEISCAVLGLAQLRSFSFIRMLKTEMAEASKSIIRAAYKEAIVRSGNLSGLEKVQQAISSLKFAAWLRLLDGVQKSLYGFHLRIDNLQKMLVDLLLRFWPDGFPDEEGEISRNRSWNISPTADLDDDESSSDVEQPPATLSAAPPSLRPSPSTAILPLDIRSLSQLQRSLSCLVNYAVEFAHTRVARMILMRCQADDRCQLFPSAAELAELSERAYNFISIGAKQGWLLPTSNQLENALKRSLVVYVDSFHRNRKEITANVLDKELWKPAEPLRVIQEEIDKFTIKYGNGTKDGESEIGREMEAEVDKELENDLTRDFNESLGQTGILVLEGEKFVIVSSAALVLTTLIEHCEYAERLPNSAAPQLLLRTVELLKMFNSRTCQLILGAGALHTVGLKTISVKNLTLASRSLQLIAAFIPFVEKSFDANITQENKGRLRSFHKVRTDFVDHINEIVAKLVSVIDHYATNCIAAWSVDGAPPSPAMQQICKQLAKFHQGMNGIFPPEQIEKLFLTVHENVKRTLRERFDKLGISHHDTLSYGIVCEDYAFYTKSVCGMEGCEKLQLGTLEDVILLK